MSARVQMTLLRDGVATLVSFERGAHVAISETGERVEFSEREQRMARSVEKRTVVRSARRPTAADRYAEEMHEAAPILARKLGGLS